MRCKAWHILAAAVFLSCSFLSHASGQTARISPGAKVFLQPIGGFGADLTVAIIAANLPIVIVKEPNQAQFEIAGRRSRIRGGRFSQEADQEVTLTITNVQTGVVIDAYSRSEDTLASLARACAERLRETLELPSHPETPLPAAAPSPEVLRAFVQGDLDRLPDFIEALRRELRAQGIAVNAVQRGQEYDYSVVFVRRDSNAAAVALNRQGIVVASVLDTGFRASGVTRGSAEQLAREMAAFLRP